MTPYLIGFGTLNLTLKVMVRTSFCKSFVEWQQRVRGFILQYLDIAVLATPASYQSY